MAKVLATAGTYAYEIKKFLGLNEAMSGDSNLKPGEAVELRNFCITQDGSLRLRPGTKTALTLSEGSPVRGVWHGTVRGGEVSLAACGGHVWNITGLTGKVDLGTLTDSETHFFGMNGGVYILNGTEYLFWDGSGEIQAVAGYIPCVVTAAKPAGGGTLLEGINLLTSKRRERFSADGTSTEYHLTEAPIESVLSATVDGSAVTGYTVDAENGVVKFTSAPAKGLSNVEITYDKGEDQRSQVTGHRYSEFYNGAMDTRVFLYGNGTNVALYSGLDEDGVPRGDYFPALYEVQVGSDNTAITGMVRHYSRLLAFKAGEAYKIEYSARTLADDTVTAGFYVRPINRELGNVAPGQMALCDNNPVSLCAGAAYLWKIYYSTATVDERSATRISDRVQTSLQSFDLKSSVVYDNRWNGELWIAYGGNALIYNYWADCWYSYMGLPAIRAMFGIGGQLYIGTESGTISAMSTIYHNDDGANIDAYWESGSMNMGASWKVKYSRELFVDMRATSNGRLTVTALSDRSGDYYKKELAYGESTFAHLNFAHFSFATSKRAKVMRARIRVPRFSLYKLVFSSDSGEATALVTGVTILSRAPRKVR